MPAGFLPPAMAEPTPEGLARGYYEAIDEGAYDRLGGLLAPEFEHVRPDRTIEGRDAFVRFMGEERPEPATTHQVDAVYEERDGDGVVARGQLLGPDGSLWFGFVDCFAVEGNRLARLVTYANERVE